MTIKTRLLLIEDKFRFRFFFLRRFFFVVAEGGKASPVKTVQHLEGVLPTEYKENRGLDTGDHRDTSCYPECCVFANGRPFNERKPWPPTQTHKPTVEI